jgi:hypothetical protein
MKAKKWISTVFGSFSLFLALLLFSSAASAQSCTLFTTQVPATGVTTPPYPDCSQAAAHAVGLYNSSVNGAAVMSLSSSTTSSWIARVVDSFGILITENSGGACSSVLSTGSVCKCSVNAGKGAGDFITTAGAFTCEPQPDSSSLGCVVIINVDLRWTDPATGIQHSQGKGTYSGSTCDPKVNGDGSNSSTPQASTKTGSQTTTTDQPGTCVGYVNDQPVKYKCSTPQTTSTSTTSDGSKTSTTTRDTTCSLGICVTRETTTTTGPPSSTGSSGGTGDTGGTTGGTGTGDTQQTLDCLAAARQIAFYNGFTDDQILARCRPVGTTSGSPTTSTSTTTTESQGEFCEKRPDALQCRDGSFSGSCKSGFVCEGDAAMCAAARGTHETKCALKPLETDENNSIVQIGLNSANGLDPSDHPKNNKQTVNLANMVDKTNPFNSSCPNDMPLQILDGVSISIPLSEYCGIFQILGRILVGLTLLSSAFWLIRT